MADLGGVVPAVVTPFTAKGDFNETAFREVVEHNIQAGVHGFWIGGGTEATYRRAMERGDGFHAISNSPEELAPVVARLREARPGDDFTVSFRTGWDPQGMDPSVIAEEAEAYAAAGVEHVVCAPWRDTVDDWVRSMELLVEIVGPET